MTWKMRKVEDVTPAMLFEISRRHHLVPESIQGALRNYHALASSSIVLHIADDDHDVATVIVSGITPNDTAEMDLVPVGKFFRGRYIRKLRAALSPLWTVLFGEMMLRRITAYVPHSRGRSAKALQALGFVDEGVMREGIKFRDRDPEDLAILGLLKDDIKED